MTLYGYARVSVREPGDKNLDLQVERLVRAGCSLGHIRAVVPQRGAHRPLAFLGSGPRGQSSSSPFRTAQTTISCFEATPSFT